MTAMLAPVLTPRSSGLRTLTQQALAILAKYGAAANLYLPGVGAINGITAGNWLDSVGTTAATVDNPVGLVVNARGGPNLVQATTANKPVLRLAGGVYAWQFDGTNDSFASTLTPGNAGFFCLGARFIDSGTVRTLVGAGAGGFFESGVWLNRSIDGNLSLIGGNGFGREVAVTACPTGTTFVASCGWTTSSMFVGVNGTETSGAKSVNCTSANTINLGVLTGTKNPMLGTISGGAIIMPTVLPTVSERATLRQLIASLSGVAL